jgi:hypothetical protein
MQLNRKLRLDRLSRSDLDFSVEPLRTIAEVVQSLHRRGMLERFHGECLACADIVQQTLAQKGITSRIVETQLSIISADPRHQMQWRFVGFNNPNYGAQGIDTHVVVITETAPPILIDLSISGWLEGDRPWVIEPVDDAHNDPLMLARYDIESTTLTYHPKQNPRLMGLHQQTLLDRQKSHLQVQHRIRSLGFWILAAVLLSGANTIMNITILAHRFLTGE